jgi:hypothetical protein
MSVSAGTDEALNEIEQVDIPSILLGRLLEKMPFPMHSEGCITSGN